MLYLLKASRVREYHKENLAILAAEEHEPFSVTYSHRWVQPDLAIEPGSGAAIVFADSPYESYVPVRFAKIDAVERDDQRLTITGTLGPMICADDPDSLTSAWLPGELERPGKRFFLFEDDNHGLGTPTGFDDATRSWDRITTSLRANEFFAKSTLARVTRLLDPEEIEVDPHDGLRVGDRLVVELDVRAPAGAPVPTVQVASEPQDAIAADPDEPASIAGSLLRMPLTIAADGELSVRLSFRPEPLLSCRPMVAVTARAARGAVASKPKPVEAPSAPTTGIDLVPLVSFLEQQAHLNDAAWVRLFDEHLLDGVTDSRLLEIYAAHAMEIGAHDKAFDALSRVEDRSALADESFLLCALHVGESATVRELVETVDISDDVTFARLLVAAKAAPAMTTQALLERVLDKELLGEAKLTDLIRAVVDDINSVPLVCRAADAMAYVEPSAASSLLLDRWPDPTRMPDEALDLLVDWDVEPDRMGPYVMQRIEQAAHLGDVAALQALVAQIHKRGDTRQRAELLAAAGLPLLLADDQKVATSGFDELCAAGWTLAGSGGIDQAREVLRQLDIYERGHRFVDQRQAIEQLTDAIDRAIEADDRFVQWQRMQDETAYDELRPKLATRSVHLVGAQVPEWCEDLKRGLGAASFAWHESEKDKSANTDWANGLDADDVVLVITDFIGHDVSGQVKEKCKKKGAVYIPTKLSKQAIIDALRATV